MKKKKGIGLSHAFRGLILHIKSERNAKIQAIAAILIAVAGLLCGIEPWAWTAIAICVGLVFAAEIINSAIERICAKLVGNTYDSLIRDIKDMGAGAVLVTCLISLVVAAIVFCRPEIWSKFIK